MPIVGIVFDVVCNFAEFLLVSNNYDRVIVHAIL